jgi:hypothetical protein
MCQPCQRSGGLGRTRAEDRLQVWRPSGDAAKPHGESQTCINRRRGWDSNPRDAPDGVAPHVLQPLTFRVAPLDGLVVVAGGVDRPVGRPRRFSRLARERAACRPTNE